MTIREGAIREGTILQSNETYNWIIFLIIFSSVIIVLAILMGYSDTSLWLSFKFP